MAETKLPRGIDEKRPGEYRARIFFENRQVNLGSFQTIGDAKAALDIARGEKARGTFIPPSEARAAARAAAASKAAEEAAEQVKELTVAEWAEEWLDGLRTAGRSPGTLSSYSSTLNVHVLDRLGSKRLVDVSTDDIDKLVSDVSKRKGPTANVGRTLRAMFRVAAAKKKGGLVESPVHLSLPKPKRAKSLAPGEIPTAQQIKALREAMPEDLAIAVDLAAWCATRLGEVLGLQRGDLELTKPERAVLHIRRQWNTKANPPEYRPVKRGSARSVSIPAALVPRLREHLQKHVGPGATAPILPSPRVPTTPVSQTTFDKAWREARKVAGVRFRFHDMRHHGLTAYGQAGATLAELMARGGHTDVAAVLIYQTATAERDRALTSRLAVDGAP